MTPEHSEKVICGLSGREWRTHVNYIFSLEWRRVEGVYFFNTKTF